MKSLCFFMLFTLIACDGHDNNQSCIPGTYDSFHNLVVCSSSEEPKNIRFTLAGIAACNDCLNNDFPVAGLYVRVFPADAAKQPDVLEPLGETWTGGLGPFELPMTGVEGMKLRVEGQLYRDDKSVSNPVTLESSEEITVPSHDDEIVTFTINFSL